MTLCTIPNQTLAVLSINDDKILNIKGNQIIGLFGKALDKILAKLSKRKCNLIGSDTLGERLDNGTWTGNLGFIQSGKADMYLKSEAPLINEKWLYYSLPFYQEKFLIIEDITNEVEKNQKINSILNNFNFGFNFLIIFIVTNLIAFIITILFQLSYQKKEISFKDKLKNILRKNIFYSQWNLRVQTLSIVGLYLIFYFLHIWFLKLIITNNIKVNKVIVDDGMLIKSKEDALNSKKTFCFVEGETELSIALTSSKTNILRQLYDEKSIIRKPIKNFDKKVGERCLIKKVIENAQIDQNGLFSIVSENAVYVVASVLGNAREKLIIWLYQTNPVFQMTFHLILKNQKDLIIYFNKLVINYTEMGIQIKLLNSFRYLSYPIFQSNTIYTSLEDFVNGNSKFDVLTIDNFRSLFILYLSFCLILLLINFLNYFYIKCLNKNYKYLNRN